MKALHALLLALALPWTAAASVSPRAVEEFVRANRLCEEGTTREDFLAAAASFETILAEGGRDGGPIENGAVLYDLGNAYRQAGEPGRALAAYRRAMQWMPRDPRLSANLEDTLRELGRPPDRRALFDHVFFWDRWLGAGEATRVVVGLAVLAFVLAVGALAGGRLRRALRVAAWCAVSLALLAAVPWAKDLRALQARDRGVVIAGEAVARKGASEGFAAAFTEPVHEGAEFSVVERRDGWIHARFAGDLDGWLPADAAVTY